MRETTIAKSPMAINHSMIGRHAPILGTAVGRAWLAFAPEKDREIRLHMLRLRNDPDDLPFLRSQALDNLLDKCREVGFGMRLGETFLPKTSSIAMPVRRYGQIIACLSVIWITSAMSYQQARDTLAAPMRRDVKDMEQRLTASLPG